MPRVIRPELLDDAADAPARNNLRDLVRINRWFGGHAVLRGLVGRFFGPSDSFTAVDVGAASGDMGASLLRHFPRARLVSMDRSFRNLEAAAHPKFVADAAHPALRPHSVDLVICSLFLHHFEQATAVRFLENMHAASCRGVIVIDLERSAIARRFLPATNWMFGWSPITLHDGPVSVDAGFHKAELGHLAALAGLTQWRVDRHRPWFRLSLTCEREG